jgi:predicted metal-dependent peptidase
MSASTNARLTEVKTAMLLHVPFFASLLLDMMTMYVGKFPEKFPPGNETAATDGKNIWIDVDFLESLTLPEAVFLISHEVGHAMWQHLARAKKYFDLGFEGRKFDPMVWNHAGDYVINDMLVQAKIGTMPKCGLHNNAKFDQDELVDDVYRELEDHKKKHGKLPGEGDGHGPLDIHILTEQQQSETEWKRAAATAMDAAKAMGKVPASLVRFVDNLLNPMVPWQDKLRYQVTRSATKDSHTWARPNRRRLINQGIIMPSYTGHSAGRLVIAVDTSGSIGQKEITVFLSELQCILDVCKPEQTFCFGIDAKVHDVTELMEGDDLGANPPPLGGGGGTSFVPAFEWVEEEGVDPMALIYFTDMMGTFPDEQPPYNVIWCSTTDIAAPWGELVRINIDKYHGAGT